MCKFGTSDKKTCISIVSRHVTQELTPIWDHGPSCLMNGVDGVYGIYPITPETCNKGMLTQTKRGHVLNAWIQYGSQVPFHVGFHVFFWRVV